MESRVLKNRRAAGILFASLLLLAGCDAGEDCLDGCASNQYEIAFLDGEYRRIDTLDGNPPKAGIMVARVDMALAKTASECDACQAHFTDARLVSEQGVLTSAGDTVPPLSNLLDAALAGKLGRMGTFEFDFHEKVRLKKGENTFHYQARLGKAEIKATGKIWVSDSLGF